MEGRLFISEMMDTCILKVSQTWGLIKKKKKQRFERKKSLQARPTLDFGLIKKVENAFNSMNS